MWVHPGKTGGIDPLPYPVPFPATLYPFPVPFPEFSALFPFTCKYGINVEIRPGGNEIFSVRFHPYKLLRVFFRTEAGLSSRFIGTLSIRGQVLSAIRLTGGVLTSSEPFHPGLELGTP